MIIRNGNVLESPVRQTSDLQDVLLESTAEQQLRVEEDIVQWQKQKVHSTAAAAAAGEDIA